jgi:hypothetical protein
MWRRRGRHRAGDAGHFGLEGRARAALHGRGHEAGHDIESGGDGRSGSLRSKHRGQRIGRSAAGASGDDVADSLMKFVASALNALEVLAKRASNGLIDGAGRVGVLWHANIDGFSCEIARFVILEARFQGVNHLRVPLCPEVPLLGGRVLSDRSRLSLGFLRRHHGGIENARC